MQTLAYVGTTLKEPLAPDMLARRAQKVDEEALVARCSHAGAKSTHLEDALRDDDYVAW